MPANHAMLMGANLPVTALVQLIGGTVEDTQVTPADATASVTFGNDGFFGVNSGSGDVGAYAWKLSGAVSDYQLVVSIVSGTLTSGAAGTFPLSTSRTFSRNRSVNTEGTNEVVLSLSLEKVSNPGVSLAAATLTLRATVSGA